MRRVHPQFDGRPEAALVWPGTWKEDAAEMLRLDLAAAGIPYATPGPDGYRYDDFAEHEKWQQCREIRDEIKAGKYLPDEEEVRSDGFCGGPISGGGGERHN